MKILWGYTRKLYPILLNYLYSGHRLDAAFAYLLPTLEEPESIESEWLYGNQALQEVGWAVMRFPACYKSELRQHLTHGMAKHRLVIGGTRKESSLPDRYLVLY